MIPDEQHLGVVSHPLVHAYSAPQSRRNSTCCGQASSNKTLDVTTPRTCSLPNCVQKTSTATTTVAQLSGGTHLGHEHLALPVPGHPEVLCKSISSRSLCCSPCVSFPTSSSRASHHSSSESEALSKDFLGVWDISKDNDPRPVTSDIEYVQSLPVTSSDFCQRTVVSSSSHLSPPAHQNRRQMCCLRRQPSTVSTSERTFLCPRFRGRMGTLSTGLSAVGQQLLASEERTRTLSLDTTVVSGMSGPLSYFRVVVFGGDGVGKSTLVRQLADGDYCDAVNDETEDDLHQILLSVELDEEESTVEVVDSQVNADIDSLRPDAFLVVYSVSDRKSFETAVEVTQHLRSDLGTDRTVYLVANKTDLRRQQRVSQKEGRRLADANDCQFMEISAALRVNVDMLLIGVLTHIRKQLVLPGEITPTNIRYSKRRASSPARAFHFFSKLLRHAQGAKKVNVEYARFKHGVHR